MAPISLAAAYRTEDVAIVVIVYRILGRRKVEAGWMAIFETNVRAGSASEVKSLDLSFRSERRLV